MDAIIDGQIDTARVIIPSHLLKLVEQHRMLPTTG